jgi:hypothetical protein
MFDNKQFYQQNKESLRSAAQAKSRRNLQQHPPGSRDLEPRTTPTVSREEFVIIDNHEGKSAARDRA